MILMMLLLLIDSIGYLFMLDNIHALFYNIFQLNQYCRSLASFLVSPSCILSLTQRL